MRCNRDGEAHLGRRFRDRGGTRPSLPRAGSAPAQRFPAADRLAALEAHRPELAVAGDLNLQILRQRVDDRGADAVQPAEVW